jgi:succinate-semialdehyde dehydrogenase/glutarate-semialdehyde dehydrogenase
LQKLQSEALKVLFENLSYNGGFAVINPATEQDLIRLKTSALEDIDTQLVACKHAQVEWAKLSAKSRSAFLKKWFQLLVEHTEGIILEQRKSLVESRGEAAYGASLVEWFADVAKRAYGEVIPCSHETTTLHY